ncbi:type VI secretion system tube protein TssD [Pedobacter hartonius]|uniref:Type VI secretion system needle protein Hcp n=1 Tax=Pedobacter hartonius TaxID=425514 RepID=A0A1H4H870_9SPHI|nr:type VI secretion system tube protein TssD [Pedobacter hartonius]SEB17831.1 hypothetical protein SAMN05443550_11424 [Pedobacter hartonius]
MAFKATLTLSANEYDVLYCSYDFNRDVDPKGRPASGIYGGKIEVHIEANADTSALESMVNNQYKAIEGSLEIKKQDEDAKMKEIKFSNAYVIELTEELHVFTSQPMLTKIVISAKTITIGNATHENEWPK